MFGELLEAVHGSAPRIHCITNYVTANDCANLLLACDASPIMADEPDEVAEITAQCRGLVLNLGTPNSRKISSMLLAGKCANAHGIPVVLDPVGVGASSLRMKTAQQLLREVHFSTIRGNISEIKALAQAAGAAYGVDAAPGDRVTMETLDPSVRFVQALATQTGSVIAVTGALDLVSGAQRTFCIRNGHPMMSRVTGTGCQLSALTGAFLAANPTAPLNATAAAVCAMGLAGQLAHRRLTAQDGNASYRNYIIDAMYHLTPEQLEQGADYEVR